MLPDVKYHAFISYSHRDRIWGDWLHKALETYKVPPHLIGKDTGRGYKVPERVYPVFRDREELPTATDLGAVIGAALQESRYLLVICSPNSARSMWVNQEIVNFKRIHGEHRILALIVAGEPNAADGKPGFTPDQECFPEAMKYQLGPDGELDRAKPTEPIAGDARPHADGKANALLKLLAGVLGVNYDDLRRRDEQRKRRRLRIMLATVSTLLVVFAALAVVATLQSIEAKRQRAVAEHERGVAEQERVVAERERDRAEAARRNALATTEQIQSGNERQAVEAGRFDDALLWIEEQRQTRAELGLSPVVLDLRRGVYIPRLSRPNWSLSAPGGVTEVVQRAAGEPVWILHTKGLFRAAPDAQGRWQAEAVPWGFEDSDGLGVELAAGGVLAAVNNDVQRYDPTDRSWRPAVPEANGGVEGAVLTDRATGRLGWLRGTHFEIWDEAAGKVLERRDLPALAGLQDFTGAWDSATGVLAFKGTRTGDRRLLVLDWPTGDVLHDLPRTPAFAGSLTVAGDKLVSVGSGGGAVEGELVVIPLGPDGGEPRRIVTPWPGRRVIEADAEGFSVMLQNGSVHTFDWNLQPQGEVVWVHEGASENQVYQLPDGWLLVGGAGARWAEDWRQLARLPAKADRPDGFVAQFDGAIWTWSDVVLAELDPGTGAVHRFAREAVDAFRPGDEPDVGWALAGGELRRMHLSEADADGRMTVTVTHAEPVPDKTTRLIGAPEALAVVGESGGYEVDTTTGQLRRRWWRGPTRLATTDYDGVWTVAEDRNLGRLEVRRRYWKVESQGSPVWVMVDPADVAALSINRDGEQCLVMALLDGTVLELPLHGDQVGHAWYDSVPPVMVTREQLRIVTGRTGRKPQTVERLEDGRVVVAYTDGGMLVFGERGEVAAELTPFGRYAVEQLEVQEGRDWLLRASDGSFASWRRGENLRFMTPPGHAIKAGSAQAVEEGVFYARGTKVNLWSEDIGDLDFTGQAMTSDELDYVTLDPGRQVLVGLSRNGVGRYWVAEDGNWNTQGQDFPWSQNLNSGSFTWIGSGQLALCSASAYLPALTVVRFLPETESWAVTFSAPLESLGVRHRGDHLAATAAAAWLAAEDEPWLSRVELTTREAQRVALSQSARELALAGTRQQWIVVGMQGRIEWRDAGTLEPVGVLDIPSSVVSNRGFYARKVVALPDSDQVLVGTGGAILQVDLASGEIVHKYETDGYVWAIDVDAAAGRIDYVTEQGVGFLPMPADVELRERAIGELVPGREILRGGISNRVPGYTFDENAR